MNRIVIIDKTLEISSQGVVSKVKKILNVKKVGHTGTLDPMATGVLPILIGDATKLSKYLIEHDKKYIAVLKLGEKRTTGDSEGEIVEKENVDISKIEEEKIKDVLKSFLGESEQTPSIYSAIKVNGKKLYEYAREGKEVEIPSRKIFIKEINLLNIDTKNNTIEFEAEVSKGTYIRSLCEDIAKKLSTIGYMSALRRVKVDKFDINQAITLEELENNKESEEFLDKYLLKTEDVFNNLKKINLNKRKEELFLNGVKLIFELEDGLYNIYTSNDEYLGIGIIENNLLKRDVIVDERNK